MKSIMTALLATMMALPVFAQEPDGRFVRTPLLAVKTNLLFDAVTAINAELEVPIGHRWSVAGECIFPWWLSEKKQYCLQMFSGNLEGRYWFGHRDSRSQMTGWFAGLHVGAGCFDLEWGKRGYQGEFYIISGLSGGYAHAIGKGKNWRMEYALGAGYLSTRYREYTPVHGVDGQWHLVRQQSGRYAWIGPTRAKISLVWMLHYCHQTKGGGR